MNSASIRQKFLDFFRSKGHQIVPSAPLVVKDDPTLMFTNAGMNQFKDYFLGNIIPVNKRIADTQKCLRVSGKHNDLEEVGIDTYHHTMFEMLGNWSFGDYFKEEAIAWAWELLTEVYQLPKDRLYITVFGGDEKDGLERDDESVILWKRFVKEDRILYCSKKDNFWEMGDTGPCGTCSEIHIDLRDSKEIERKPGKEMVNQDHPQVIEIWNLVFIQFNRKANGALENLPEKHVDTGMGLERLVRAIHGMQSNYDTDIFQILIREIEKQTGFKYGQEEKVDIAMRVISDHIRAVAFCIADGQIPSNNKAGYVIRRILRRAVRYGYTFLELKAPFLQSLLPVLSEQFKEIFPELDAQSDFVQKVIREEEANFLRTLEHGLKVLEEAAQQKKSISGSMAFELYDTFGFPFDLTALIARENNLQIDIQGFETELQKQKNRSRAAVVTDKSDWNVYSNTEEVTFVGYDSDECESGIIKSRISNSRGGQVNELVLDKTPFYAESGGQVGDTGIIVSGSEIIRVTNTLKENNLIIHQVDKLPSDFSKRLLCKVDVNRRGLIRNNHSATHLLHAALRQILGPHVSQKGSLVSDKVLRFDFSHFSKLTDAEIEEVERLVNKKIRENISLIEQREVSIEEAKKMGAMALFGEKYGDKVRVISFDPSFSVELCGGTHVPQTGQIGFFKIVSEVAVAAGVRRIEAVTAIEAENYVLEKQKQFDSLNEILKHPKDLEKAVSVLIDERTQLLKRIDVFVNGEVNLLRDQLIGKVISNLGVNYILESFKISSAEGAKKLSFDLKQKVENLVLVLALDIEGKPMLSVMISENIVELMNLDASKIVKELGKLIDGGGGGQKFYATAGGKNLNGLSLVIEHANKLFKVNDKAN